MGSIEVGMAKIPERDELLRTLEERGFDAKPLDEDDRIGIEVACGEDPDGTCAEVLHQLELWISETGLPLVPLKGDGVVFLRPPGD